VRAIIVGYGNQGRKRYAVAKKDIVGIVDHAPTPYSPFVPFFHISDFPLADYDAAIVCTPTQASKLDIVKWLLENGKHVLVEKPLWPATPAQIMELGDLAERKKVVLYPAYNHRWEPAVRDVLDQNLGNVYKIYHCRMFYGNGTAELVKQSWRDQIPLGVIPEVGSHLFDLCEMFFGGYSSARMIYCNNYENDNPDHAIVAMRSGSTSIELEMTYLSWKNTFTIDILTDKGSLHVEGLTKWGRSIYTSRIRQHPAGVPEEKATVYVQPDSTWEQEWRLFNNLVADGVQRSLRSSILMAQTLEELCKCK